MLESVEGSFVSRGGHVCWISQFSGTYSPTLHLLWEDKDTQDVTRSDRLVCSGVLSNESAFHILFIFRLVQSNNMCTAQHCVVHT